MPLEWVVAVVPAHPRWLAVQVLPLDAVHRISSSSIRTIIPGSTVAAVTDPVMLGVTVKLSWLGEVIEADSVPKGNWQSWLIFVIPKKLVGLKFVQPGACCPLYYQLPSITEHWNEAPK